MTTTPRFGPVTRRMVSEEVRDALLESIESGALAPGAQLPSERALCEDFGVARTSVREAVRSLVALGRVHKVGNRFHVVEQLPGLSVDPRKSRVRELFECRRVIEVSIARFAAERAGPREREELMRIAAIFSEDMELEEFRHADRLFHGAIARCCGNPTLRELYGKVLEGVFASEEFRTLLDSSSNAAAVRDVIAESCLAHRRIAEAIRDGDPDIAAQNTERHLDEVEQSMIDRMV
ncbi:GntR family transcriptional repressor for pyruvate dehydrogenase complex [Thermocatellispora tengchongensis]|uniref:GntR family transcriptional repressor for pyruvate dehydrogenase complex n=1 Tax=Thermocatellispora tengchongensis TaxID=1073253 RepID=A0A840P4L0_9ACTN|nr:FCD domain-containing protein [Thermocatellispora tengchongensis]MBB5130985.1 GntR family transcriptional repressor for pyruvate dehydrogenase complex [Thermocatellispora tengchongensis]